MQILFGIFILFHGFIHLLGFAKALQLAEIPALKHPISKPAGLLWLTAAVLFGAAGLLIAGGQAFWWIPAAGAVFISQNLIVLSWKDAKFGTVANIITLLGILLGLI